MYLPSLEYMSNHRPLAHRDLIPISERIPCMFCKKLYSSDQGLNRHVNQVHTSMSKVYPCKICTLHEFISFVVSIEFSSLSSVGLTNSWYQLHNEDYTGLLEHSFGKQLPANML